jgi:hypothetical protein
LCHLQHKLIGFYNRDEKCLQRGTDWVFKQSGLRFVFKWLNIGTALLWMNCWVSVEIGNAEVQNFPEILAELQNLDVRSALQSQFRTAD